MTTAAEARDKPRLDPVNLVEVALRNSGPTLYFSDRNIEVGGQLYENYLRDLSGLGEELRRADSSGLNSDLALRFRNDAFKSYDYLVEIGETYPFEGAVVTVKEVYLDDDGAPSDAVTVFKGVLDEPRNIDLLGFECLVSSMEYARDREWKQAIVNTDDWPDAYEDLGEVEPIVYGGDVRVPALRVSWGARTTLQAEITDSATSLELTDGARYPASDFSVWIDDEKIHVGTRTGNSCTSLTRGYGGTTATAHKAGAEVWEALAQYDSLLAGHELHIVGDILAEVERKLWRVVSGVSAVLSGGKHLLRATDKISVQPVHDNIDVDDGIGVGDNIGVSDPGHYHSVLSVEIRIPTGATKGGTGVNWTGVEGNVYDQSDITSLKATGSSGLYNPYIEASFPAYSGPTPVAVYACITHKSYVDSPDTDDWVRITNPGTHDLDASGQKVTQKINIGTSVPQYLKVESDISSTPYGTAYMEVFEMWLEVHVDQTTSNAAGVSKSGSAYKTGTVSKTGGVVATRMVERFHAVVKGYKDPDGNYGGSGNLVERPDYVIKHFLVELLGFALADIDTTSFGDAGTSYGTEGYKLAFRIDRKIKPSEWLARMARECRSVLKYRAGKWYLDFIPDAAPSALKTITKDELAGEGAKFVFSKTPVGDVANDLTARFKRNYSRLGNDSEWDGTSSASDSASQAKYGTYPKEFDFECVRLQAMADDVLAHMLTERKAPRLRVEFPVWWEHFDLAVGDTVDIDNPLYDGRKFFVEEIRRLDEFRALIRAVEWW